MYAIQQGFDYTFLHNEKARVSALCKKRFGWKIHAYSLNDKKTFQIKTFFDTHNCGNHYRNKRATLKWASERYLDNFQDQPDWKATALKEQIRRDYNIKFSLMSCHRWALSITNRRHDEQYKHVREYTRSILKWNPGSSA